MLGFISFIAVIILVYWASVKVKRSHEQTVAAADAVLGIVLEAALTNPGFLSSLVKHSALKPDFFYYPDHLPWDRVIDKARLTAWVRHYTLWPTMDLVALEAYARMAIRDRDECSEANTLVNKREAARSYGGVLYGVRLSNMQPTPERYSTLPPAF